MGQDKQLDSDEAVSETESRIEIEHQTNSKNGNNVKKKYQCTFKGCEARFIRPSKLERHIRGHTGERPYKCTYPECDKTYTNSSHLKRHVLTHTEPKKRYECPDCLLQISGQHNFKRHCTQMHGERKITCKKCNVTFNKKSHLAEHMSIHYGTLHTCDKCNKSFTLLSRYKEHKKTVHDQRKIYPCPVQNCTEKFDRWLLLVAHRKAKHVNERKCNQCEKVFATRSQLKIHSQTHSKDRSVIPCPYDNCHKVYYFKRNLTGHIQIKHIGAKVYCDMCKEGFVSKLVLTRHIQKIHENTQKKKASKKLQRKKRKDIGIPKRSMVSAILGLNLSPEVEKELLERQTDIKISTEIENM